MADDDACDSRSCSECKLPTLRYKQNEGTLVCTECGLVDTANIIDPTKEQRSFAAENTTSQQLDRTGDRLRLDQLNSMYTELRGNNRTYNRMNQFTMGQVGGE